MRDGHVLWVEESGNPEGVPVLFLHGGPGSGCKPHHRGFFDPQKFRVFLHDQRGSGASSDPADISKNTTQEILLDLKFIQDALDIPKWLLFGGSWGATLALLYAEAWPNRVAAMVLRGAFLAREQDLSWFVGPLGVRRIYPEAWRALLSMTGLNEDADVVESLHQMLLCENNDSATRLCAAQAWEYWGGVVTLGQAQRPLIDLNADRSVQIIRQARIELHYAKHRYFIEENQILQQICNVSSIPTVIIHGRRDLVCPPDVALALHGGMPHAKIRILEESAHVPSDAAMISALIEAAEEMAEASL